MTSSTRYYTTTQDKRSQKSTQTEKGQGFAGDQVADVSALFLRLRNNEIRVRVGAKIRVVFGNLMDRNGNWQASGDEDVDNDPMMTRCLGAGFGSDLVHPSTLGHAMVADFLIGRLNQNINIRSGFGGFSIPIPKLLGTVGNDGLQRQFNADAFSQETMRKRSDSAYYGGSPRP